MILITKLTSQFPRLYFIFVLLFLTPLSFFVFFQLFQLMKLELFLYRTTRKNVLLCNSTELLNLFFMLIKKNLWLDAIKLIEVCVSNNNMNLHQSMNALGFAYFSIQYYSLAKYYYLEALKSKKDYIVALKNLAFLYKVTKNDTLAKSTYQSIIKYDPANRIAVNYLAELNK